MPHSPWRARTAPISENASLSSFGFCLHDESPRHVLVAVAAILRTQNRKLAGAGRHELDDDRCIVRLGARHGLLHFECFDFDAVGAVRRSHDETHTIAFRDLDRRWLEHESARDDLKYLRLTIGRRRLLAGFTG